MALTTNEYWPRDCPVDIRLVGKDGKEFGVKKWYLEHYRPTKTDRLYIHVDLDLEMLEDFYRQLDTAPSLDSVMRGLVKESING